MNRTEYLEQQIVASFVSWLSDAINLPFEHQYYHRKRRRFWKCSSFQDAVDGITKDQVMRGYEWNGRGFEENALELTELKNRANKSLDKDVARDIIKWGGIRKDTTHYMGKDVVAYLLTACQRLNPETFRLSDISGLPHMNSSFTKIYSLLIEDFIIYDSRVGAALGHLVCLFYSATQRRIENSEFEKINFAWGAPPFGEHTKYKELMAKSRNPSNGHLIFPRLTSLSHPRDVARHTINNIRASWILKEVIKSSAHPYFDTSQDGIRRLEAALFMIGYDVWNEIKPN